MSNVAKRSPISATAELLLSMIHRQTRCRLLCRLPPAATQDTAAAGDKAKSQAVTKPAAGTVEAGGSGAEAGGTAEAGESVAGTETEKASDVRRVLLGVVRVGLYAQRLLLDGDLVAEMVVICAEKPTKTLLRRIATLMANEISVTH